MAISPSALGLEALARVIISVVNHVAGGTDPGAVERGEEAVLVAPVAAELCGGIEASHPLVLLTSPPGFLLEHPHKVALLRVVCALRQLGSREALDG